MQNKLILYTKQNCPACENVKSFLKGYHVPEGLIETRDITNDLVTLAKLKDGIPALVDGEDTTLSSTTLPTLEVIDKATMNTIGLVAPSEKIMEFLALLNFPPVESSATSE